MAENIQRMFWIAAFAAIGGLILIFASTPFGVARGESWGTKQTEMFGGYDPEIRQLIITAAVNKFLILGSLFMGAGLLLAMATYFYLLLKEPAKESSIEAKQLDAGGEV